MTKRQKRALALLSLWGYDHPEPVGRKWVVANFIAPSGKVIGPISWRAVDIEAMADPELGGVWHVAGSNVWHVADSNCE